MPVLLLVEDDEMNRDMLSRRLMRRGYEVVIAVDGQEALSQTHAEKPDFNVMYVGGSVESGERVDMLVAGKAN